MENFRIFQKNKFVTEIASLKKTIERSQNSVDELRKTTVIKDGSFILSNIEKKKNEIQDYQSKIEELEEKLEMLNNGQLDDEIVSNIKENTQKVSKKNKDAAVKKEKVDETEEKNKKTADLYYTNERNSQYQARRRHFDMEREYERLCSIDLPDYIVQNLKGMPNNKGYIWRGVWFFGELREVPGPCVMFDKQRDAMYIHEIFHDKHVVYRKNSQNQKELVKSYDRRKI